MLQNSSGCRLLELDIHRIKIAQVLVLTRLYLEGNCFERRTSRTVRECFKAVLNSKRINDMLECEQLRPGDNCCNMHV